MKSLHLVQFDHLIRPQLINLRKEDLDDFIMLN